MPKINRGGRPRRAPLEERNRPDLGATGQAMLARKSRVIETIEAGVTTRLMDPTEIYPIDRYEASAQISERQVNALRRLQRFYALGFGRPKLVPGEPGGSMSEELDARRTAARRSYAEAMAVVHPRSQAPISSIVRSEWPSALEALPLLRGGAEALADYWRLPQSR